MMNDGTMWGMGFGHWVAVLLVALVIAALIKHLFLR